MLDGVLDHPIGGDIVSRLLSELPGVIGMEVLAGPLVVEGKPDNPGWTGFVIIDKSHIAVHTFDRGCVVSIDVFSCNPFETEKVIRYLSSRCAFKKMRDRTMIREID